MLNVFITVDTEIWCGGWHDLDERFPDMFRKYVYGPTRHGNYALPATLAILSEYGLDASFFVETLFSARFGQQPLNEVVNLIKDHGQEIQLHIHPEWLDETNDPKLPKYGKKTQELGSLVVDDQARVMDWGVNALISAGSSRPKAFRSGSYSVSMATFRALEIAGIGIDTSYNPGSLVGTSDISVGKLLLQPTVLSNVVEYPVTVFDDRIGSGPRHLQLAACSFIELKYMLRQAVEREWDSVVLVSHNFELLSPDKSRVDRIMVKRFRQLCKFLQENCDVFNVIGFSEVDKVTTKGKTDQLESTAIRTGGRYIEQALRRLT